MIEHPEVLSQSYFTMVLKYRKIPPNDLLARTEYQWVKVASSATQPTNPFLVNTPILVHNKEPLHKVTLTDLVANTHHYFRARFVTMKGYVSPWADVYLIKTGNHILKKPVIVSPSTGIEDVGSSITLKLNDIHDHPYFNKLAYAYLEVYKIGPNSPDYEYLSTLKLDPATVETSGGKIINKGAVNNSIMAISNKFASNTSYLIKLKYGYKVQEGSSATEQSDFSENFYFNTKPYFLEQAKVIVEQVIEAEVSNKTTVSDSESTTTPPDSTTPSTTPPSVETTTSLAVKNTIVNGCVQVTPPKFIVPVDKLKLKVQVSSNSSFTALVVNEEKIIQTSKVHEANLSFFIPAITLTEGEKKTYYARASWSEYIEYVDSNNKLTKESPVNWGKVKIIEITESLPGGDTGGSSPTPTPTPSDPTPTPTPGGGTGSIARFQGPAEVYGNQSEAYSVLNYNPSAFYTVSMDSTIGGTVSMYQSLITFTAGAIPGSVTIKVLANLPGTNYNEKLVVKVLEDDFGPYPEPEIITSVPL